MWDDLANVNCLFGTLLCPARKPGAIPAGTGAAQSLGTGAISRSNLRLSQLALLVLQVAAARLGN